MIATLIVQKLFTVGRHFLIQTIRNNNNFLCVCGCFFFLVAPTKALCNEIFQKWQEKFSAVSLNVALVTGDSDPTEMSDLIDLSDYHIAVTTPEKWDSMTRKWRDHHEIANAVRLIMIDEVHLVGDTSRGPTLEAIISRIKTFPQNQNNNGQIRIVTASASLPNIEDVAKWIGVEQPINSVRTFK